METQISELLTLTYYGPNDEEIKNAENELFEMMAHTDFFLCLYNIILNDSNPIGLRSSAIIYLNNLVRSFWDQENSPIDDQIKKSLFQFIPQLLKISPLKIIKTSSNLAKNIICKTYLTNEWPEIYEEIINGFSDDNQTLCSLTLSNSLFVVSASINKKYEMSELENLVGANQYLIEFISQNFIEFVSNVFQSQNTNMQLLMHCYKLVNKILNFKDEIIQHIYSINDHLSLLTQEMIHYSNRIQEFPSNDPFFESLLRKIMKFLTTCISKPAISSLISIEFIISFLPIAQETLKSDMSNSTKCNTVELLSKVFVIDAVWEAVGEEEAANALISFISPLFSVSSVDFEMAYEYPADFINENQKICEDFNDLKASSSNILFKSASKHNVLIPICLSNISNSYRMFENGEEDQFSLFSTFHMCSMVINLAVENNNDDVLSLFSTISPLFQISEDENVQFANAAAFFLLASCQNLQYPMELIQIVFDSLDNPFNLIRYFAIECISAILRQISCNSSLSYLKDEIFSEFGEKLEQSLRLLLEISKEVSNEYMIESFTHFLSLFGERLLPFSQELAQNFLEMINDITNGNNGNEDDNEKSEKFSNLYNTINSFSSLLKIISKSDEISSQLYPMIYETLIQLYPSIPETIYDAYFSLFGQIVLNSTTFNRSYWSITEIFNQENSEHFNQLIELIQFKDNEMLSDESSMQFMVSFIENALTEIDEYDEFEFYCPSITGFLLRVGQNVLELNGGQFFLSIVQKVLSFIQFLISNENGDEDDDDDFNEHINSSIVRLLNALMIVDCGSFFQSCGDENLPFVFNYWEQSLVFPFSVPAAANVLQLQFLDDDQKSVLLSYLLNLCYKNMLAKIKNGQNEEEDDDDDDDDLVDTEKTQNCPWFEDKDVIPIITQIFGSCQQNPGLFEKCDQEQLEFLIEFLKSQ